MNTPTRKQALHALDQLPPRDANLLRLRWGLNAENRSWTMQRLADHYGIGLTELHAWLRRVEGEALRLIRS